MTDTKQLRMPFRAAYGAGCMVTKTVNTTIDGSIVYSKKISNAVVDNKYVAGVTNAVTKIGSDVKKQANPFTQKVSPYVAPYAKQASPYVKPAVLVMIALSIPVVLCFLGLIALVTFPIWAPIAFFTSLLWIPLVIVVGIVSFLVLAATAFVATVRYLTMYPKGKKTVQDAWAKISSPPMMQTILFCPVA
eukprot:CAMPEP_0181316362 /NCGR_PEP_ID=MMETSP1101-20121128/15852_1 /TAXON_ID=46948 /ORGANISM="Rhodomonas abbreviata, Strain Caron Lab Isolate" /LENGTH=189 /DNA_ID=CAMNT_0023423599 /DNA_START=84 /DNA_END=653 /DNA_ORIENTATION=-